MPLKQSDLSRIECVHTLKIDWHFCLCLFIAQGCPYRCLSFCPYYFWPLCCPSFDLLIMITPLVSSRSS